ncbi:MAG: hypothetical protein V7756_12825 [Halopseudomonas sp.]|uniref:hypothetical protein n=1 Tax=Halopseudomonas sp. TaxID=2901191 RepID=UPI0030016313
MARPTDNPLGPPWSHRMPTLRNIQQGRHAVLLQRMGKAMTDKPDIAGYAFPVGKGLLLANDVTEPEKHKELALIRLTDHESSRAADKARIAELESALNGVLEIVSKSTGVAGYHLNGDVALWDEFDDVSAADAALAQQGKEGGV